MSDIPGVRKEFMDAIEFTRKRLLAKMEAYADEKFASVRLREQRYSTYFLAKANCFGLAWASYNSGELNRARAAAAGGCALLAATEDDVHTEYAQVMYAQVLTAKTPPVEPGHRIDPQLQEAFTILQRLVDNPKSALRTIPKFLARAQYALAGALFDSGQYDKAEALAKTIYQNTKEGSRWHLECMALLIRILLKKENISEAREYSDKFLALTKVKSESQNARAEAWLCRAEVLLKAKTDLDEIDEALTQAQTLWATNSLSTTICHLHRARVFVLRKNSNAARNELSSWKVAERHIEQGYVRELAKSVEEEIAEIDDRFVITPQDLQAMLFDGVEEELKRWAIRYLYSQCKDDYLKDGNPDRILGRSARTVYDWQIRLCFDPREGDEGDEANSASASS
jgi:predicted Zn-dependent protease